MKRYKKYIHTFLGRERASGEGYILHMDKQQTKINILFEDGDNVPKDFSGAEWFFKDSIETIINDPFPTKVWTEV